ncbi:hypothetical protein CDL12_04851 [Handroanthus impetiginosus]|uniref:Myosin heavy chain n=1 Tax=Handroanthus impetiginosus TaxID=429701 RepID=A0A2G9HY55_9LAMI|nr:hypothetical protein CDL12_04851 [Handroanthus impetiginosus]
MNQFRANSSPNLIPSSTPSTPTTEQQSDDSALEGVAANVKLLLKLIQDHKDACDKEKNDHRRTLRVATMMTILDNVKERIQKSQSFGKKRSEAELRRCNTDLRPNRAPKDKRQGGDVAVDNEKERLKREFSASLSARKSLHAVCSSLGKEKEIMAAELSKKVQELNGMEELINDLKAQNETLLEKVRECALEHKEKKQLTGESQVAVALQERNKMLSDQLLKSLDGYKSIKRKLKAVQEENVKMHDTVEEIGVKVVGCLERVRSFKERIMEKESGDYVEEEIMALESMFEGFQMMVAKFDKKQGECVQHKGEINACKASVVA